MFGANECFKKKNPPPQMYSVQGITCWNTLCVFTRKDMAAFKTPYGFTHSAGMQKKKSHPPCMLQALSLGHTLPCIRYTPSSTLHHLLHPACLSNSNEKGIHICLGGFQSFSSLLDIFTLQSTKCFFFFYFRSQLLCGHGVREWRTAEGSVRRALSSWSWGSE